MIQVNRGEDQFLCPNVERSLVTFVKFFTLLVAAKLTPNWNLVIDLEEKDGFIVLEFQDPELGDSREEIAIKEFDPIQVIVAFIDHHRPAGFT